MNEFLTLVGMSLATFIIRYTMFAYSEKLQLPDPLLKALNYVPPAVLTAIVVPAVLLPDNQHLDFSYTNARLIGSVVALFVGWFSQNLLLTIVLGMLAFLGWHYFLPG